MNLRRGVVVSIMSCVLAGPMAGTVIAAAGTDKPHKVVFQVSDGDPAKWNLALNNVRNVQNDLGRDKVAVELVAYGPGIAMLKMDSVVANRIAEARKAGVAVVACENTMRNSKITREDMLPDIGYVEAGVVELMKLQKEGYAYIRP